MAVTVNLCHLQEKGSLRQARGKHYSLKLIGYSESLSNHIYRVNTKHTFCSSRRFSFFSRSWVQNGRSRCLTGGRSWIKNGGSRCLARSRCLTRSADVFCRCRFWKGSSRWQWYRRWRAAFAHTSFPAVLYQISGSGWPPTVSKVQLTILVVINVDTGCEEVTVITILKKRFLYHWWAFWRSPLERLIIPRLFTGSCEASVKHEGTAFNDTE